MARSDLNPAGIPLALYIHLPWCAQKCPYCDFNSFTATRTPPRQRYVDALLSDLDLSHGLAPDRPLVSVFLGGGTPSLFEPGEIAQVLAGVLDRFELAPDVEITMEANPGTLECGSLEGYREAGVNRLSIGAQSFSDDALARLGRIHRSDAIRSSVNEARQAGFDNINLDIMYCLPEQDVPGAVFDIEQAAALEPEHLSWYHLTLEPNTVFHDRPPEGLPGETLAADIQDAGAEMLGDLGFERYEVSAWATPGRQCRHNLNYWRFGDYLAAGAGAHGKISSTTGASRIARPANPEAYMRSLEAGAPLETTPVAAADLAFEFMLNALRLTQGFDMRDFEGRTGLGPAAIEAGLDSLEARGLLIREDDGHTIRPSSRGFDHLNELMATFLPQKSA